MPPLPPHHASEEEAFFLLQVNLSTRVCFFISSGTLLQRQCSPFPVCQQEDLSAGSFSEAFSASYSKCDWSSMPAGSTPSIQHTSKWEYLGTNTFYLSTVFWITQGEHCPCSIHSVLAVLGDLR